MEFHQNIQKTSKQVIKNRIRTGGMGRIFKFIIFLLKKHNCLLLFPNRWVMIC